MDNAVDLDHQLCPHKRMLGASDKIPTDPNNLMDNWFISSKETKRQRDSREPRDRKAWDLRRALHPISKDKVLGSWQYSRKSKQRKWVAPHSDQQKLSRKTSGLSLNESTRSFPIEYGDMDISWMYRDFWVQGDSQEFLNKLYKYVSRTRISCFSC